MFKIIAKDGKEYGPINAEEVRAWIAQGRLEARSLIQPEGTSQWKALSEFPEFGADLNSGARVGPPPVPELPVQPSGKVSRLALTSLILGVLAPLTLGITAFPGFVLGIIALIRVQRSRGRLSGNGLAIGGTCVSGAVLLVVPVLLAMLLPALAQAKNKAQSIQCMNNIKQLNLALIMYATDHKDVLPPADQWCDLIRTYTGGSMGVYHCASEPDGQCSYAFNAALGNRKLTEVGSPANTVLIFSADDGWNQSGGIELATPHHHSKGSLSVGFTDGHAEITRSDRIRSRSWGAAPAQPE